MYQGHMVYYLLCPWAIVSCACLYDKVIQDNGCRQNDRKRSSPKHNNIMICICVLYVCIFISQRKTTISLIGRRGYRVPCTPRNILLIGVIRSDKIGRKRFAMLTSQQNVPRIILKQISAAIIEISILHYISANIVHNRTNKVFRPMVLRSQIIKRPVLY